MNDTSTTIAYITGASRGIGRLLATALAHSGAHTVAFARPSEELDSLGGQTVPIVPVAMAARSWRYVPAPRTTEPSAVYFHTARSDVLARLDRLDDADAALDLAIECSTNESERSFLRRRRQDLKATVGLRGHRN